MRTGISDLPLHSGKAPAWLFNRMVELSKSIVKIIINERGEDFFLESISNPFWFQSLGCVLGYDWHSSGLSTVLTAVLKYAINSQDFNLKVCGGKGKASLSTPNEIYNFMLKWGYDEDSTKSMQDISRMVAKVDNALLQDGYTLYHHSMFITKDMKWAIVQQGMNESNRFARRYHWIYKTKSITLSPERNIDGSLESNVLDMTSIKSLEARKVSLDIIKNETELNYSLDSLSRLNMPAHHIITKSDLSEKTVKELRNLTSLNVDNYDDLVSIKGVGPKTIRALALISELVYGKPPSWDDPVKFSYAHGGKDGTPYKIKRSEYDNTIYTLRDIVEKAKIDTDKKENALKRLFNVVSKSVLVGDS